MHVPLGAVDSSLELLTTRLPGGHTVRRWIAIAVLVVVVVLGWRVLSAGRRQGAAPPEESAMPVEVRPVEVTTLVETVVAGGAVAAVAEVTVISKATGRVAAILIKEGDSVRAGQVLVRLETGELMAQVQQAEAGLAAAHARLQMLEEGARPEERAQIEDQVRQAEANLAMARARLQMLEQGARPQERAQAEAAVAQAKANLDTAKASLDRTQALYETGAVSKAQLDAAQLQYDVARAQYDAAVQQRSVVQVGPRSEEIDMARSQVRAAQAQRDAAVQQRAMVRQGARVQEIQMARAAVAQTQAAVALARLQLANATVTAPFAGTVTRRFVDPGQLVIAMPGQGFVATVAQIDTVHVGFDVSETDIARVHPGQPVAIRVDAYPGKAFAGTVREVGQAADPRVRAFRVKASVPNPGHLLKPGMFARGEITTAIRERALVIPREAVGSVGGETTVFVVEAGKARVRPVRLGMMSGAMVQVVSGLAVADPVVVAGQGGLVDGVAVTVR
jgi:HlyD family secretion protein